MSAFELRVERLPDAIGKTAVYLDDVLLGDVLTKDFEAFCSGASLGECYVRGVRARKMTADEHADLMKEATNVVVTVLG
jgi:hypothetical protein